MNQEIKQKWIAALESGDYKRVEGKLKIEYDGSSFHCCLGVLCEIHKQETGLGEWVNNNSYTIKSSGRYSESVLPDEVVTWAGINSCTGTFLVKDEEDVDLLNTIYEGSGRKHSVGDVPGLTSVNDASEKPDFSDVIPFIKKHF